MLQNKHSGFVGPQFNCFPRTVNYLFETLSLADALHEPERQTGEAFARQIRQKGHGSILLDEHLALQIRSGSEAFVCKKEVQWTHDFVLHRLPVQHIEHRSPSQLTLAGDRLGHQDLVGQLFQRPQQCSSSMREGTRDHEELRHALFLDQHAGHE